MAGRTMAQLWWAILVFTLHLSSTKLMYCRSSSLEIACQAFHSMHNDKRLAARVGLAAIVGRGKS